MCSRFWCIWYVSEKPEGVEWNNDDWIQVEGEISTEFYQPFHANIPVLEVTKWNKVEQPKEQYVFREPIDNIGSFYGLNVLKIANIKHVVHMMQYLWINN